MLQFPFVWGFEKDVAWPAAEGKELVALIENLSFSSL